MKEGRYFWKLCLTAPHKQCSLIRVCKLHGGCTNKYSICTKWLEGKTHASEKADQQLCTGPSGTSHSAQQLLASSLSRSEAPHIAHFSFVPDTNTPEPAKSKKQTLVAKSTALTTHLARLAIVDLCTEGTWTDTSLTQHCKGCSLLDCEVRTPALIHSIPGCRIDTKSKFIHTSGCQECHLTVLAFLLYEQ